MLSLIVAPIGATSSLIRRALERGATTATDINEMRVQEFIADLKRTTFERRRPDGSVLKNDHLARKTILNIVGVLKLVLGKKIRNGTTGNRSERGGPGFDS